MKFLPHDFKQLKHEILQLDSSYFFLILFWMNTIELVVLSGFDKKMALVL